MAYEFDFTLRDSWKAVGRVLSIATGQSVEPHQAFVSAWVEGKKVFLELLGPTGRVTEKVKGTPDAFEVNSVLHDVADSASFAVRSVLLNIKTVYMVNLEDIPRNSLSEPLPDPRVDRKGKKIPKGTKVTRYIELVAEAEGLTQEEREELRRLLSIAISRLKPREYVVVLSVNPLDMLLMSEHTAGGWRSCHRLAGEYAAGPQVYMQDKVTAVAYAYLESDWEKYHNTGLVLPKKIWRQLFYFDFENRSALAMREYPCPMSVLTGAARKLAARVLRAYANKRESNWKVGYFPSSEESYFIEQKSTLFYLDDPRAWVKLPGGSPPRVEVGVKDPVCPLCGYVRERERDDTKNLLCGFCCGTGYVCTVCECRVPEDEVYWSPCDEPFCGGCAEERFTYCHYCGRAVWNDYAFVGADDYYYCEHCWEEKFTLCKVCDRAVRWEDTYSDVSGNMYCRACFSSHTWNCACCGDYFPASDKPYRVFNTYTDSVKVCESCFRSDYEVCAKCGRPFARTRLVEGHCQECRKVGAHCERAMGV